MSIALATSEAESIEYGPAIDSYAKADPGPVSAVRSPRSTVEPKASSFSSRLSAPAARAIDKIAQEVRRPTGMIVFLEGEATRGVYLLCEGRANVITANAEGKTLVLRVARPGDVLGLNSVFAGTPHAVTVETLQPCRFAFIAREDFLKFLGEYSDGCLAFAQRLGQDCDRAYDLVRAMASPVSTRLARFLISCCGNEGVDQGMIRAKLFLTHEGIARRIGCSRETVSRMLSHFKRRGVAELVGTTLLVHDRNTLESLSAS